MSFFEYPDDFMPEDGKWNSETLVCAVIEFGSGKTRVEFSSSNGGKNRI